LDILFQDNGRFLQEWMQALARVFPNARVRVWQEGDQAPADYAIVWKPQAAMLHHRQGLKAIFSRGAGVDGILESGADLPAGVPVIRLTDAGMGVQMAEYVSHAALGYFREFGQYRKDAQAGLWQPRPPLSRKEFRIGVLGMGVLGQKIIRALQQFEFPINAWSRSAKELDGVQNFVGMENLPAFLQASKVLVCILPLTDETRGILHRQHLSLLPQGAYLINVARGAHVNEADLLALIQEGHLAGATLDVFQQEPLPTGHPFWQEPKVTITPHIAAITLIEESAEQIAQKIDALQKGEVVEGIVDRQRGY